MDEEYLYGFITVCFAIDVVSLSHKVQGRFTFMDLGEGDFIEVEEGDGYKVITVEDALNTIVQKRSKLHNDWERGRSYYEGRKARVKIDPVTTNQMVSKAKRNTIRQIFRELEHEQISKEDALKMIMKWDVDFWS